MTFGECIRECPASKELARDIRRQLLVWRQRDGEHRHRFERLERRYRKHFGTEAMPDIGTSITLRLAAIEQGLEAKLR